MYIGVTSNIARRIYEHRQKTVLSFSKKYNLMKLVYAENYKTPQEAIAREKQLKNWHRDWKINLIESINPQWNDLYETL